MATTEVAEALEALDFLQEVNVYGVTVPGAQPWEVGGGDTWPLSLNWYDLGAGNVRLSLAPPTPGHEGRAGMAALALRPPHSVDLVQLYAHVSENLPPYAWPRFLRLQVTIRSCCDLSPRICIAVGSSQTAERGPHIIFSEENEHLPRHAPHPFICLGLAPPLPCHLLL